MGYRSDVGICMSKSAYNSFQMSLAELQDQDLKHQINELLEMATKVIGHNNSGMLFYWSSIKWSDLNSECVWIDQFLKKLDDKEYLMIILGQDYNDVEIFGNYWNNPFNMSLERHISFLGVSH